MTELKFLKDPVFRASYRGEFWSYVAEHIPEKGTPCVSRRWMVQHDMLGILTHPKDFWTHLHQIGTVRWDSPVEPGGYAVYPPPVVMQFFPGYLAGRWSEDFGTFEVEGEPPMLYADAWCFSFGLDKADRRKILWQGKPSEMNQDIWFQAIAPHINKNMLAGIVNHLLRTGIDIPVRYRPIASGHAETDTTGEPCH